MRDVVNKNVTEEQLLETARRVFSRGWDKMKLYFMIGLPTEEDEDVLGIVETGKRAQDVGRRDLGFDRAQVVVAASTHVPKPHTPFQWCAMDDHPTVVRKQGMLKDAARKARIKLRMHDSEGSWIEGILARGDRTLANMIETAYQNGARFDSWSDCFRPDVWEAAIAEHGVKPELYLGTIPVTARLPWDHLDVGLEPGFLVKEYRKALRNRLSPPCGKAVGMFVHHASVAEAEADKKKLVCYHCGVACDLGQMREERLVFLRRIDKKREDAPVVAIPAEEAPRRAGAPKQARFRQGEPLRVRLAFSRTGRIAWGSHLDLIGIVERIFRRARWPLFFSEGFNPKPVMMFPPALAVGTMGLREFVDVKLDSDRDFDLESAIETLNSVSIEGIVFLGGVILGPNDRALSRVLNEVEYLAVIPRSVLAPLGLSDDDALRRKVEERMAAGGAGGELKATRVTEGITRTVNVADFLVDAEGGASLAVLENLGIGGDVTGLRMTMRLKGSGAARPGEVVSALLGSTDIEAKFIRTAVYAVEEGARVDPLSIEPLRRAPSAREVVSDDGGGDLAASPAI
jgi:radical SAM-linked protein